jgi:NADH dehydrogenase
MRAGRVVIVGGGFAGLTLAQRLERVVPATVEIVLVGAENHMVFSPMLAEVVGRSIEPLHVVVAGRQMVRRTRWLTATVNDVDLPGRRVGYVGYGGERVTLEYDHLVLACGSVVNVDLVPGIGAYAYPLKTLGDAMALGNDLLRRLEQASAEVDPQARARLLSVVVVGGGFSGVEVAGQMSEILEHTRRFYPELRDSAQRVILLQGADRLMPELNSVSLSAFAMRKLRKAGIDVRLGAIAQEVTATGVLLRSGEHIEAATVVSTIGTITNPLVASLGLPLDHGRLPTAPDMSVPGAAGLWALGDCALVPNAFDGRPSPPTAQFAMRQARQLAANLARAIAGTPTKPFRFRPLGMLASLGHQKAVAEILGLHLSGLPAWLMWRAVYLGKLPTLSRKLEVLVDWTWKLFFAPNVVELRISRTSGVGRAHYAAGELVIRQGERGDRLFVVETGTAAVFIDGNPEPVTTLRPGDTFGAHTLGVAEEGGRSPFSVRAVTALDLATVEREEFLRLAKSPGTIRAGLSRMIAARRGYERFVRLSNGRPELLDVKVGDVMERAAPTLAPTLTLVEVASRFDRTATGFVVVDERGRLAGYCGLSELHDAIRAWPPMDLPLSGFMRTTPPTVTEAQSLRDALGLLLREQIEWLPVLAADGSTRVIGMLELGEVFRRTASSSEDAPASTAVPDPAGHPP